MSDALFAIRQEHAIAHEALDKLKVSRRCEATGRIWTLAERIEIFSKRLATAEQELERVLESASERKDRERHDAGQMAALISHVRRMDAELQQVRSMLNQHAARLDRLAPEEASPR